MSEQSAAKRAAQGVSLAEYAGLEQEKSRAIRALILGAANDFNNAVMAVSSYAELELKKASSSHKRTLQQLLKSTTRASSVMQTLVELSKPRTPAIEQLFLNEVVRSSSFPAGASNQLAEGLELDLDQNERPVKANIGDVRQAVLYAIAIAMNNEVINDKLVIRTKFISQEDNRGNWPKPGSFMELSIGSTSGRSRFSNLPWGGEDLLLKMMGSISGAETMSSQAATNGYQAYFQVEGLEALKPASTPVVAAGSKVILVVDDDDAVRVPAIEFLKMEGYRVLQASTGAEALKTAQQGRGSVDLLLTDVSMKGMDGHALAVELRKSNPNLRVIYMSGNSAGHATEKNSARLQKPFPLNSLISKIHEMLT